MNDYLNAEHAVIAAMERCASTINSARVCTPLRPLAMVQNDLADLVSIADSISELAQEKIGEILGPAPAGCGVQESGAKFQGFVSIAGEDINKIRRFLEVIKSELTRL
jgi:hypothetical protein